MADAKARIEALRRELAPPAADSEDDCVRCNAHMSVEPGMDPTAVCHDCIWEVAQEFLNLATSLAEELARAQSAMTAMRPVIDGLLTGSTHADAADGEIAELKAELAREREGRERAERHVRELCECIEDDLEQAEAFEHYLGESEKMDEWHRSMGLADEEPEKPKETE